MRLPSDASRGQVQSWIILHLTLGSIFVEGPDDLPFTTASMAHCRCTSLQPHLPHIFSSAKNKQELDLRFSCRTWHSVCNPPLGMSNRRPGFEAAHIKMVLGLTPSARSAFSGVLLTHTHMRSPQRSRLFLCGSLLPKPGSQWQWDASMAFNHGGQLISAKPKLLDNPVLPRQRA